MFCLNPSLEFEQFYLEFGTEILLMDSWDSKLSTLPEGLKLGEFGQP